MKKRFLSILLCSTMVVGGFVGCSSKATVAPSDNTSGNTAVTEAAGEDGE